MSPERRTQQPISHSGSENVPEGMRERPCSDSDTPLDEHVYQIPETVEQGFESSPLTDEERRQARPLQMEEDVYDPNKQPNQRRRMFIGASAVLGLILAGGVVFGVSQSGSNVGAERPPVATASANPGETSGETVKSPLDTMTMANFPYEVDGKTYVGFDALKKAYGITAKQFEYKAGLLDDHFDDATDQDVVDASTKVVDLINTWLNYNIDLDKLSPEMRAAYEAFEYSDANGGHTGVSAVKRKFVDTAFEQLLASQTDLEGAAYPTNFLTSQAALAARVQSLHEFTQDEAVPYRAEYKIVSEPDLFGYTKLNDRPGLVSSVSYTVQFVDNSAENSVGESSRYSAPNGTGLKAKWSISMDSSGTSAAGKYGWKEPYGEFGPYWRINKIVTSAAN
jgi:hypothetical protein